MSNPNTLSFSSSTFKAMQVDFDNMLSKTLASMEKKEAEEGSITVKIGIKLQKELVPDVKAPPGTEHLRLVTKPRFDHKVSAAIQYKYETSGTFFGDYELVWDNDAQAFLMIPIPNGQQSLFDEPADDPPAEPTQIYLFNPNGDGEPADGEAGAAEPSDAEENNAASKEYEYEPPEE